MTDTVIPSLPPGLADAFPELAEPDGRTEAYLAWIDGLASAIFRLQIEGEATSRNNVILWSLLEARREVERSGVTVQ